MRRHATLCWGEDAVAAADAAKNLQEAREKVVGSLTRNGSITEAFERKPGKITYSHRPHTQVESRTEIVKWLAENLRPYKIVSDRGFLSLMKTGRPGYFIPSPSTVARDMKAVFVRARSRIAKMLQVSSHQYRSTDLLTITYRNTLVTSTSAWTSGRRLIIMLSWRLPSISSVTGCRSACS